MSTIGFSELFVIAMAMVLPCLGFLIVSAILFVVFRLTHNKHRKDS